MTTGTAYSDAIADLLLDDANDLTPAFEAVLEETFVRFGALPCGVLTHHVGGGITDEDEDKALSDAELDAFATALNGAPFSSAEKTEIKEYFNTDTKGYTHRLAQP